MQNNTSQILVSVVMPVYNAAPYLASAIDSILNQTHTNFEFIIINDGSSDNSANIISSYQDKRIVFVSFEEQKGIVAALNFGLSIAKGEFVARMDADDESLNNRFDLQLEYLIAHPEVGVLGTQYIGVNGKSRLLPITHDAIVWHLLNASPFVHPSIMFRSSFLKEFHIKYNPGFQFAEDLALWVEVSSKTKLANLSIPLIKYRYHNGTHQKNIETVAQLNTAIKRSHIANLLPELDKDSQFKLAIYLNRHIKVNYTRDWFKEMFAFFDLLVRTHPTNYLLTTQLNNCVWFHLTACPRQYFGLIFTIQKLHWINLGLVKSAWLLIKLIK